MDTQYVVGGEIYVIYIIVILNSLYLSKNPIFHRQKSLRIIPTKFKIRRQ